MPTDLPHEDARRLLALLEDAFRGVALGEGVSLHETPVLDSYGTAEERRAAREPDEKHDWRRLIHEPDLARLLSVGYSGLSFFDAAGLRFHLPACLSRIIADPEGAFVYDMLESVLFHLAGIFELPALAPHRREQLAILDPAQRACVREVLIYFRDVMEVDDEALARAIVGYWSEGLAE
jgi:hypothetical protein